MPITLPNLDNRLYADLVEEGRDLLIAYAPALTDHNPADPAITLLELFAWFTEALLFRVNNVTDANRVKFLQLLNGPDWVAPTTHAEIDAQVHTTVLNLRTVDRAVTAADFESLAVAADPAGSVARAHCIPERNLELTDPILRQQPQPGHVSVVIVPAANANATSLLSTVAAYLDPRRLLTARVHVVSPNLVPVSVQLTLRLEPDALQDQVLSRVMEALQSFFDPIVGRDGHGWPFGRSVYVSEIYRLLDGVPGVDFARQTLNATTSAPLDELTTTAGFAGRAVRNAAGGLISIALDPDELVAFQAASTTIVLEAAPTTS